MVKIINKESEHFGNRYNLYEIVYDRIVTVIIDGRKVDFGMSEVEFENNDWMVGREINYRIHIGDYDVTGTMISTNRKVAKEISRIWNIPQSVALSCIEHYLNH